MITTFKNEISTKKSLAHQQFETRYMHKKEFAQGKSIVEDPSIENLYLWNHEEEKRLPTSHFAPNVIRRNIDEMVTGRPKYTYYIRKKEKTIQLPHIKKLDVFSEVLINTVHIEFGETKKKIIKLDLLRRDLEIATSKNINDKNTLLPSITYLLNEYGTLKSYQTFNDSRLDFDEEYRNWLFLITKLVPYGADYIKKKPKIDLSELNRCFKNVNPKFKDINQRAVELIPDDLLGAIVLYLKTQNLKKAPIKNCENCGAEISQSQSNGRPVRFCRNNNKCKMQFYRKDDR